MSYQVDTNKLITIGNLSNFYNRLWDEMEDVFESPNGIRIASDEDVDAACFNVAPSTCDSPDSPNGEHSWVLNKAGDAYVCEYCHMSQSA